MDMPVGDVGADRRPVDSLRDALRRKQWTLAVRHEARRVFGCPQSVPRDWRICDGDVLGENHVGDVGVCCSLTLDVRGWRAIVLSAARHFPKGGCRSCGVLE